MSAHGFHACGRRGVSACGYESDRQASRLEQLLTEEEAEQARTIIRR